MRHTVKEVRQGKKLAKSKKIGYPPPDCVEMMSIQHIHFLGICGTAMGAVASAMARKGYMVTGSDENVYPPMSTFLSDEGITVYNGYRAENLGEDVELVVIGNALSRGNEEVEAVLQRRLRYMSLPEAMKEFFLWGKHNFVVTGTHGKTTTTSMLTWLMEDNGLSPSFMIGGIARNLGRGGRFTDSNYCVLEGDEYDTAFFDKRSKFLHYLPSVLIVNNIEMDHADIYHNVEEINLSFSRLLRVIPSDGVVFMNADCPNCRDVHKNAQAELGNHVRIITVGMAEDAQRHITQVDLRQEASSFVLDGELYSIPMVGEFNVRNAAMAACAAMEAGLAPQQIRDSLVHFQGVARRQEVRGTVNDVTVVDDFAHHPTAVEQSIAGLRQRFPKSRLWAIFDPRSNTMIRDLFRHELAASLGKADFVVLSPVENYKKLTVEERLDEESLARELTDIGKNCHIGKDIPEIVTYVTSRVHPGDVLLVMSNGGFGGIHNKLLTALAQ